MSATLLPMLLAAGLAGVVLVSGPLVTPAAADAAPQRQRICPGQPFSADVVDDVHFKLWVPANTPVGFRGTATAPGEATFHVEAGTNPARLDSLWADTVRSFPSEIVTYYSGQGTDAEILVRVAVTAGNTPVHVTLVANLANTAGPCGPLSARETTGKACATKHAAEVQGTAADPVNTATGNFNEPFEDISIPGRGPGIALNHAYCDDEPVAVAARV